MSQGTATRLHLGRHAERRSHDRDVFAALVSIVALVIVAAIVVAPIAWALS